MRYKLEPRSHTETLDGMHAGADTNEHAWELTHFRVPWEIYSRAGAGTGRDEGKESSMGRISTR